MCSDVSKHSRLQRNLAIAGGDIRPPTGLGLCSKWPLVYQGRASPSHSTTRSYSPAPALTMAPTSQKRKKQNHPISDLVSDIQALSLGENSRRIPPAQAAFGSVGALFATIKVRSPRLRLTSSGSRPSRTPRRTIRITTTSGYLAVPYAKLLTEA